MILQENMESVQLNLKTTFEKNRAESNLEALTDDICRNMLYDTKILKHVSKRAITNEYSMYFSRMMRVNKTLDFYLLWEETMNFLSKNGIKVIY